jgi:hypothetical protein
MAAPINGFNYDPNYPLNIEDDTRIGLAKGKIVASATLAAAVALTILGAGLVASGVGTVLGAVLISVSLPMCYFSYNISKTLENCEDIVDNRDHYRRFYGFGAMDETKITNKLRQNTFCFNWFSDWLKIQVLEEKKRVNNNFFNI